MLKQPEVVVRGTQTHRKKKRVISLEDQGREDDEVIEIKVDESNVEKLKKHNPDPETPNQTTQCISRQWVMMVGCECERLLFPARNAYPLKNPQATSQPPSKTLNRHHHDKSGRRSTTMNRNKPPTSS